MNIDMPKAYWEDVDMAINQVLREQDKYGVGLDSSEIAALHALKDRLDAEWKWRSDYADDY